MKSLEDIKWDILDELDELEDRKRVLEEELVIVRYDIKREKREKEKQ